MTYDWSTLLFSIFETSYKPLYSIFNLLKFKYYACVSCKKNLKSEIEKSKIYLPNRLLLIPTESKNDFHSTNVFLSFTSLFSHNSVAPPFLYSGQFTFISTHLVKPKFFLSLPHRRVTAVSSETNPLFVSRLKPAWQALERRGEGRMLDVREVRGGTLG